MAPTYFAAVDGRGHSPGHPQSALACGRGAPGAGAASAAIRRGMALRR